MPPLHKQFKHNLPNDFIAISKDNLYITYSDEIFSCQPSADITVKLIPHSTL